MKKTITSANSIFLLSVGTIYPVKQRIEGFAMDNFWTFDRVSNKEVRQGVDGQMSAGWLPHLSMQTITLQPDKSGYEIFLTWQTAEESIRETLFADATIALPAINKRFVLSNGVLTSFMPAPDAKKVLEPLTYQITWGTITPSLI